MIRRRIDGELPRFEGEPGSLSSGIFDIAERNAMATLQLWFH
jgi:hypothetical protein